jgi:DNA-binding transcriptional ArsR family regulator
MVYNEDAPDLDMVFGALAHPTRRRIVVELARCPEPVRMGDVAAAQSISLQLLDKHVAVLERAGLVSRSAAGRERHVHVHPQVLTPAVRWMESIRDYWNGQLDSLDSYVARLAGAHRGEQRDRR